MGAATAFGSGAAEVLTAGGATPLAITTLGLSATLMGDGSNIMLGEYKHSEGAKVLASVGRPVNSYAWDGALAVGKTGLEIGTLSLLSRALPAVDAAVTSGSKVLSKEVAIAGKAVQREAVILEKQVDQDFSYTHNHVAGHNRAAAKMEAKQVKNVVKTGEESGNINEVMPQKQLLPNEGKVGGYNKLTSSRERGSNLSAHHMPNSQYIKTKGVPHEEGISMLVDHPIPGGGGRHREIHKFLQRQDPSLSPRDALAQSVLRAREVYKQDGVYTDYIRNSFMEVIKQNKEKFPTLFEKIGTK